MTNDELNNLFSEITSGVEIDADAVAKEVATKDGLTYSGDFDGANGHSYSVYVMTLNGKNVFNVVIDNFAEVPVPANMGTVPAGITAHTITVVKPGQVSGITTNGLAFRTPHPEGTHIDGRSVQSFIYPRVVRFLIDLYVA